MKRIAYWALHYGREYLAWSVRSVQDAVDELHFLYTDTPSYGTAAREPCPETEDELVLEAKRFAQRPVFWHRGRWPNEGAHRESIYPIARSRGADQVLVVDADEVWAPGSAALALAVSEGRREGQVRVRFRHFWRSFGWACTDPSMPVRVLNLGGERPLPGEWYLDPQTWPVLHFGYAQSVGLMRYKWTIHGHQAELRPDWFEKKFIGWKPGDEDVHPTCDRNFWNPVPTDQATTATLRAVLGDHRYWGAGLIL